MPTQAQTMGLIKAIKANKKMSEEAKRKAIAKLEARLK